MSKCETSFKIGDKVKLVASSYPDGSELDLAKGEYFIDHVLSEAPSSWAGWDDGSSVYTVDNGNWNVTGSMLEFVEDVIPTPKSLLKDFMRVVTEEGETYIIVKNMAVDDLQRYIRLETLDDNLESLHPTLSVKQIFECGDNSQALLHSYQGNLIWQRESEEELEKKARRESLKASMKVMQTELEVMKKQLEEMK